MVNFSAINCSNERWDYNQKFEKLLKDNFRYTREVNAHVLYNFVSPTNRFGEYDFFLFVDIPNMRGNYYRVLNRIYLDTLAIAVRRFEEPEVIDVDDECFYTEDGSWEYKTEIESDRQALRSYVYDNIPNVKHFDVAIVYIVNAPNCTKDYQSNYLWFNKKVNIGKVIFDSIILTQNKEGVAAHCIVYQDKQTPNDWSEFIKNFIDISEEHTHQGILTKKKVDHITKKKTGRLMEQASQAIGNRLCVIRGKAGTGKTLALLRLMYEQVRKGEDAPKHNCRLLTFNNMLVMDLKMIMKNIGDFTPTKASISSLHKFFYDIYKVSPVRYLHMDSKKINSLFNLCMTRTLKFNSLMNIISREMNTTNMNSLIRALDMEILRKESRIKSDERAEWKEYQKYLLGKEEISYGEILKYAQEYVEYKRKTFLENYYRQEFLNGYNVILEELYLIFHSLDDFLNKYNMRIEYSANELRNNIEFEQRYQEVYNQFLSDAEQQLQNEYGNYDDLVPNFMQTLENLDREAATEYSSMSIEQKNRHLLIV